MLSIPLLMVKTMKHHDQRACQASPSSPRVTCTYPQKVVLTGHFVLILFGACSHGLGSQNEISIYRFFSFCMSHCGRMSNVSLWLREEARTCISRSRTNNFWGKPRVVCFLLDAIQQWRHCLEPVVNRFWVEAWLWSHAASEKRGAKLEAPGRCIMIWIQDANNKPRRWKYFQFGSRSWSPGAAEHGPLLRLGWQKILKERSHNLWCCRFRVCRMTLLACNVIFPWEICDQSSRILPKVTLASLNIFVACFSKFHHIYRSTHPSRYAIDTKRQRQISACIRVPTKCCSRAKDLNSIHHSIVPRDVRCRV